MACILGIIGGFIFCLFPLFKFYVLVYFVSSMWITLFFYSYIYKPVFICRCVSNEFDKTWVEFNTKYLFIYLFEKFKILFFCSYKIYIFRCLILIFFLIIIII